MRLRAPTGREVRRVGRASLVLVAAATLLCVCSGRSGGTPSIKQPGEPGTVAVVEADPVALSNSLALRAVAAAHASGKNAVLSPSNLYIILSMVHAGAAGRTRTAVDAVLGITEAVGADLDRANARLIRESLVRNSNITLSIAQSLWIDEKQRVLPSFKHQMLEDYLAGPHVLALGAPAALRAINQWFATNTSGAVASVIPVLPPQTRFVAAGAAYFRGAWASPFPLAQTEPQPFTLADGTSVSVPMMAQSLSLRYLEADRLQIAELPYAGGRFAMLVCLPAKGSSLSALTASLSVAQWNDWEQHLQARRAEISMPRFTISYSHDFKDILETLGMRVAFSPAADFSGISGHRDLALSAVWHQAVLSVDEHGTQAAAGSAAVFKLKGMAATRIIVDHPFLAAIVDRASHQILFIAAIEDPR